MREEENRKDAAAGRARVARREESAASRAARKNKRKTETSNLRFSGTCIIAVAEFGSRREEHR